MLIIQISVSAQNAEIEFIDVKSNGNKLEFKFDITGISNEQKSQAIKAKVEQSFKQSSCEISGNKHCKIVAQEYISASKLYEIFKSEAVDFDYLTVKSKNHDDKPELKPKRGDGMPDDFPIYVNTGDKSMDDKRYDDEKADWILNNKDKYDELTKQVK